MFKFNLLNILCFLSQGLNAQFAKLGVLSGHIRGNYSASKKLAAGVLHGTTEFTAKPIVEETRITSIVGRGQASVKVVSIPPSPFPK